MKLTEQHQQAYDRLADEYEANVPLVRPHITGAISPFLERLPRRAEVLEVGCGVGLLIQLTREQGHTVTALDISERMVAHARKRNPGVVIYQQDFLDFESPEKYDGIMLSAFIHLFPRPVLDVVLAKAVRLLKPGGLIWIDTTKSDRFHEGVEVKQDYVTKASRYRVYWTTERLREKLAEHGFVIESWEEYAGAKGKMWIMVVARHS